MNETLNTIYQRRAIRKYKDQTVDKKLIEQIIDAGRMAPSAMNKQTWRFYVLTDKKEIKEFSGQISKATLKFFAKKGFKEILKLAESFFKSAMKGEFLKNDDFVFHKAPAVIFITGEKENEWVSLDIGMCAQNMMLAAKSLGLESCPVGLGVFVEQAEIFSRLRIPAAEKIILSLIIGYGDETPKVHERKKDNLYFID